MLVMDMRIEVPPRSPQPAESTIIRQYAARLDEHNRFETNFTCWLAFRASQSPKGGSPPAKSVKSPAVVSGTGQTQNSRDDSIVLAGSHQEPAQCWLLTD